MKTIDRARRAVLAAGCLLLAAGAPAVRAQDAGRPLEWVVGYAAGGGSDAVARITAEALARSLKRPVIINNKPGAATNIAADYAVRSRDYGNILLTADFATLAANPFLFSRLIYNAEKDLAPVGMLARFPLVLVVGPQVPARNWPEFLAWARAQPGLNYASAGAGSPHHLATEMLAEKAGLTFTQVPYRGAAPALQDVLGGNLPFMLIDTAVGTPVILAGKVRAIGVARARRIATLPEVPTLAEQGLAGYEASAWQGVSVPAGTPAATVAALNKGLVEALNSSAVKARFQALGVEGLPGTPEDMARFVGAERQRWGRLIQDNHIRLD